MKDDIEMTTAKHIALCLGIIAYGLTAISAPADAVLCLGPNGHVAIESPHSGCCTHEAGNIFPVLKPAPMAVAAPTCCIDIPLPAGKREPCTAGFHKAVNLQNNCHLPCAHSLHITAVLPIADAMAHAPHAPDPPTATIILLI